MEMEVSNGSLENSFCLRSCARCHCLSMRGLSVRGLVVFLVARRACASTFALAL